MRTVVALIACVLGCSDDATGPTHIISITGSTSAAHVASTPGGIDCAAPNKTACSHAFPDGTNVMIRLDQPTGLCSKVLYTMVSADGGSGGTFEVPDSFAIVLEDDLSIKIMCQGATRQLLP